MTERPDGWRPRVAQELLERRRKYLERALARGPRERCLHDSCERCLGTSVREDGTACVHMLSCPCPRCSPGRL